MLLSPPLQEAHEEAQGIAALGIDWASLLVYGINFIILLLLLYFLAYKPVLRMLDERRNRIEGSLAEAERVREEARRQQEELERQMGENRQETQRMMEQARQMASRVREEETARARAEAEQLVERARSEIQRERDEAVDQVRREFADLSILAAERVIQRSLDRDAHRDLVEQVLEESGQLGRG